MTIKNKFLFVLVFGAILSGCVSKGAELSGTYSHISTEKYTNKQVNESIQFFNDGTWLYQKPGDHNSGVYTIHDKEILLTGQLVAFNLTIQEDGSLKGSDPEPWIKTK
jgi:outer membrane lipoprotein-sorting protein